MSFDDRDGTVLLILAGIGIGIVFGALIGAIAGRKRSRPRLPDVVESVSDLQAKAEQVLAELSASVASIEERRSSAIKPNIKYAPAKGRHNGAGEVMG